MENVELFQGIDKSSIEAIMNCFKPETRSGNRGTCQKSPFRRRERFKLQFVLRLARQNGD